MRALLGAQQTIRCFDLICVLSSDLAHACAVRPAANYRVPYSTGGLICCTWHALPGKLPVDNSVMLSSLACCFFRTKHVECE